VDSIEKKDISYANHCIQLTQPSPNEPISPYCGDAIRLKTRAPQIVHRFSRTSLIVVSVLELQNLKTTVCPPSGALNALPYQAYRPGYLYGRPADSASTFSLWDRPAYRYTLP
jgi:hypothetical protein